MINKYNPLIIQELATCGDCYENIVGDTFTFINHFNEDICIPIVDNPCFDLVGGVPTGWTQTNYVPITNTGLCDREGNGLNILGDGSIAYISWKYTILPPPYSNDYTISQDVDIIKKVCADNVKLRIKHKGKFVNTTGSTYIKIEDSVGIVWEATDYYGEDIICFKTNDTTVKVTLSIDIDEYQKLSRTFIGCNYIEESQYKMYLMDCLDVCNYYTYFEVLINEKFDSPYIPKKFNVVDSGSAYCGGDETIYFTLEYDLYMYYTRSYELAMLYDASGGAPSGVIEVFENGVLINSYPIATPLGNNQYLMQYFSGGYDSGLITIKITIANISPLEFCIKGLWIADNYDFSDFEIVSNCLGGSSGVDTIVCDCNGQTFTFKISDGDSGYLEINDNKFYYKRPSKCENIIQFRYHNSCPINTDDGIFYFTKDESGYNAPLYIAVQGVVFGHTVQDVENTIQRTLYSQNRAFGQVSYERDIAIDYIPEELLKSLSLMALCDYIEVNLGRGWERVYINKAIDADPTDDGMLNAKLTLSFGGIINSKCC